MGNGCTSAEKSPKRHRNPLHDEHGASGEEVEAPITGKQQHSAPANRKPPPRSKQGGKPVVLHPSKITPPRKDIVFDVDDDDQVEMADSMGQRVRRCVQGIRKASGGRKKPLKGCLAENVRLRNELARLELSPEQRT